MRIPGLVLVWLCLCSTSLLGERSMQVHVRVDDASYDGNEVWVGVVRDAASSENPEHWVVETAREFSIGVPTVGKNSRLIFLKKNCVPFVVALTTELLETGVELHFSSGMSLHGSVATTTGQPIGEGNVSLDYNQDLGFSLPDPALTEWEIDPDGSFEIGGLSPGRYVATVTSPGFMPASQEVVLTVDGEAQEVSFQLAKAVYVAGRIEDRYGTKVRGRL